MGTKRKAGEGNGADADSYQIDWRAQPRRPFKRSFVLYGCEANAASALSRRKALGLEVADDPSGDDVTPMPLESFEEIGCLPPWLLDALRDEDRYEPTPLQAQALPILLAGQNLVAVAGVGKGQAGAYLIPGAVHIADQPPIEEEDPGPVLLVLAPTQEIAAAIAEEGTQLLQHSSRCTPHPEGLRAVCVSGGGTRSEKLKELGPTGAHIVVGTPKRVHDMAAKEQISLLRVTMLVLDGADRMLEMGFVSELRLISKWLRPERQTALFSATWPKTLHEFARDACFAAGDPVRFNAGVPPTNRAGSGKAPAAAAAAAAPEEGADAKAKAKKAADSEGKPKASEAPPKAKAAPKAKASEAAPKAKASEAAPKAKAATAAKPAKPKAAPSKVAASAPKASEAAVKEKAAVEEEAAVDKSAEVDALLGEFPEEW